MLIKVQTAQHADNFLLIDRVDSVKYEANPREFVDALDLYAYLDTMRKVESSRLVIDPALCLDIDPRFGSSDPGILQNRLGPLKEPTDSPTGTTGRVYRLNTLTYERDGEFRSLVFDTVAYICNDEGKTLERALAGGVLNYGE